MKIKKKKKIYFSLIASSLLITLFSGISLLNNQSINEVEGARIGPRGTSPKQVNITDVDDAGVNAYYQGVNNLSGLNLKNALYNIIKDHHEFDYESSTDRYAYKIMDRNWTLSPASQAGLNNYDYANDNPYIRKLYADYNDDPSTADRFKNDGASRVSFDKEHIWAQSLGAFGRNWGAGSDFHHLLPSDVRGNQQLHSNYNFGEPDVVRKVETNDYGAYVGRYGTMNGYAHYVAEPLDEYKGDIARAMLYMPVRYNVYIDEDHPKLELVNGSPDATVASPTQNGLAGDLATLLRWHEEDPVDYYEIHRNNLIYNNFQKNRNPFIDHPEWARMVYDPTYTGNGASTAPGTSTAMGDPGVLVTSINLNTSVHSMDVGQEYTLTATVLPTNAENKTLNWTSSDTSVATITNGRIDSLGYGTTTITAAATDGSGVSASCQLTVEVQSVKVIDRLEVIEYEERVGFGTTYPQNSVKVHLFYEDSSSIDVTNTANISLPNTSLLGEQILDVEYGQYSASYSVFITNENAILSFNDVGNWYYSPNADEGAIQGWTGVGLGSKYADGSAKLDTTGDYIYKSNIWSGTSSKNIISVEVEVGLKHNGTADDNNELTVHAINGTTNVASVSIKGLAPSQAASPEAFIINLSNKNTITGVKVEYKNKVSGNYGVYHINARPTYQVENYDAQAEAWATYFLDKTSEQCLALEPQREEDWIILGNEFNLMHDEAKAMYINSSTSQLVQDAIDRYNAVIRAHPENEPFIDGLLSIQANLSNKNIDMKTMLVIFVIASLSITTVVFYMLQNRKRIN